MSKFTDPRVLRRFVVLMCIATVVMFTVWAGVRMYQEEAKNPGDFETRQGDILLSDGEYEKAIERFNAALAAQPGHRGAWGGRTTALIAQERYEEAEADLTGLIAYLEKTLQPDDPTGRGALSAAYANRGIIKDRQARYEEALKDYIASAKTDRDIAEGPGWINRLLYHDRKPSSVIDRAQYLYEQLQLPEEKRLLRVPERDAEQRIYKP